MGRPGGRGAAAPSTGKTAAIVFGLALLGLVLGSGAGYVYFYKIQHVPTPNAAGAAPLVAPATTPAVTGTPHASSAEHATTVLVAWPASTRAQA
jgi:uncharacterized protein HemX